MRPQELMALARADRAARRGPAAWISVGDAHDAARRRLPRSVMEFIDGGAEDEVTLAHNARGGHAPPLVPRVLRDVHAPDLHRTVLGERHRVPFVLAPTGFTGVIRPDGELHVARAARETDVTYTVSAAASNTDLSRIVADGPDSCWFNYYPLADLSRGAALLDRAWELGFRVLVVTVDVPVAGSRERDRRNGFTIPPTLTAGMTLQAIRHPGWTRRLLTSPMLSTPNMPDVDLVASSSSFPSLFARDAGWSEIRRLRNRWQGKIAIKGILSLDDARHAVEEGVDAVVVSNHGGRQLDGAPSPYEVVEPIAQLLRPAGVDVLLDSGVRRGRDILVALALGATAVMIGRPYLYGLGAAGQAGVERVIEILTDELGRALHLTGITRVDEVDRSLLLAKEALP